jgi:hypothetical protein
MAIAYYLPYTEHLNGALDSNLFRRVETHDVVQSAVIRPAKWFKRVWEQQRDFIPASERWSTLTSEQQTAWAAFAAANRLRDRSGAAVLVSGAKHYTVWNTNNRYYDQAAGWEDDPPTVPTWSATRPKFEEFAELGEGALLLAAETTIPAGTRVAAYAPPPMTQEFRLIRAYEKFLGVAEFPSGLSPGQTTDQFSQLYVTAFGESALAETSGQWLRLVQIDRGFARPLKDPCRPPPTPFESSLEVLVPSDPALGIRFLLQSYAGYEPLRFDLGFLAASQIAVASFLIPWKWRKKGWQFELIWSFGSGAGYREVRDNPLSPLRFTTQWTG